MSKSPPTNGPWHDGKVWVLNRKCTTCIFRPGNKMFLDPGRVEEMVNDCLEQNAVIPCHCTLDGPRSVCRGFYDLHRHDIGMLRLAAALGLLAFNDPPEGH